MLCCSRSACLTYVQYAAATPRSCASPIPKIASRLLPDCSDAIRTSGFSVRNVVFTHFFSIIIEIIG
jgi:hypothetical protein